MAIDTSLLLEFAAATLLFFITRFFIRSLLPKPSRKLPPGPKGWPLLGTLPLLGNMPHVALAKMAKRYGPVMFLKMGTNSMVVASTPEAARAFLKTLDINFSNRPPNAGATLLAYDAQDMVFADYEARWKLLRKLSNLHMLGGKALEDWSQRCEEEREVPGGARGLVVRYGYKEWGNMGCFGNPIVVSGSILCNILYCIVELFSLIRGRRHAFAGTTLGHMLRAMLELSQRAEPVVVPEMLTFSMASMIGQVILSRRVFETKGSESNEFKDMVVELMTSAGYFNIGDFIPSIAWLDIQGSSAG
ncbi:Flavonoid 3',5'-hydroxylase [Vitis vinifera]|uniref:Flavonoid 3',5'-hydroxylase n=1 Tax=Vitis vinifera TaxID=29760 RepID=A0A438I854_VITVI|nr:Flavonoid 3',5'-hydroxylase [Vitis vinifera]